MAETSIAERSGPAGFVQRMCLKRVLPEYNRDPEFVRLFQNEARLAALLSHPNVVAVTDFGCHEGTWWMTLELVEGLDLRTLIHSLRAIEQPVPVDIVVFIAAELAKALAYAHERALPDGSPAGIVHRDVSPSNVLVSYEGGIKLADFGIAKATQHERTKSASSVKGKAPYMAPEQALGEEVDPRADLFALGVMLFELLAGVRPFDGPTDLATLKNVVDGRRRDLRELAPRTPERLVAIIDGLLTASREARCPTARDVLDDLAPIQLPVNVAYVLGAIVATVKPREVIRTATDGADLAPHDTRGRSRAEIKALMQSLPEMPAVVLSDAPTRTRTPAKKTVPIRPAGGGDSDTVIDMPTPTPKAVESFSTASNARLVGGGVVLVGVLALVTIAFFAGARGSTAWMAAPTTSAPIPSTIVPLREESRPSPPDPTGVAMEPRAQVPEEPNARAPDPAPEVSLTPADSPSTVADAPAVLDIVVPPVGEVLIDGRLVGESPVTRRVPPGRHTIEGRSGDRRARQTVDVAPGERRRIVLRIPR